MPRNKQSGDILGIHVLRSMQATTACWVLCLGLNVKQEINVIIKETYSEILKKINYDHS